MANISFFDTYVNITPSGTSGWQTKDLSSYVPANSLCFIRVSTTDYSRVVGMRINGSAVDMSISTSSVKQNHGMVFCDASSIIELFRDSTSVSYFLTGYVTTAIAYKSTAESWMPSATGWSTLTSSNIEADSEMAILTMLAGFTTYDRGINYRALGSSDARQLGDNVSFTSPLLTVDSSKRFQIYQEVGSSITTYCHGNIKNGTGIGKTNGLDVSLGSTGSYVDIDLSSDMPANAKAAIIEVYSDTVAEYSFDIRKNGTSATHYYSSYYYPHWIVVGLDDNGIIEGKISNTNVKFYVWGYLIEPVIVNNLFQRRLLNEPEVQRELSNIYYGVITPQDVNIELSNHDGYFTDLIKNNEEFRDKTVVLKRYEADETDTSNILTYELTGVIKDFSLLPDKASFTISVNDPDPLQTLLPQLLYQTTDWSQDGTTVINPTPDLGKPYPLAIGRCSKVPLRYIHCDYANDNYDYAIAKVGTAYLDTSTITVYRSHVVVSSVEYDYYNGSQSSPYPGYAFIRFSNEQLDFNGSPYELHADVYGMKMFDASSCTRNFPRVIEFLLSDTYIGIGQTVDTASFSSAADETTSIYCDGHISEQRKAQDIINDMLYCCRGQIEKDSEGKWEIAVDNYNQTISAIFGWKDGFYNNISEIMEYRKTPTREAIKNYTLKYKYNEWENEYSLSNKRNIFPFGEDQTVENSFIRDSTTADRITSYVKNLSITTDRQLTIKVGMEGRNLKKRDLVKIKIPDWNIDEVFQIHGINRKLDSFVLTLKSYNSLIYDYNVGTIPSDPNADSETDYSQTAPSAPTGLSLISSGTYQTTDGTTLAYFIVQANAPSINISHLQFGFRLDSESYFTNQRGDKPISGSLWRAKIEGLIPGQTYTITSVAINPYGMQSSGNPTLTGQLAPGDTTAPGTVSGVTGTAKYKSWSFRWTALTNTDLKDYSVQLSASSAFSTPSSFFVGSNEITYADDNQSYGAMHCRVKGRDFTGNMSAAWSAIASAVSTLTKSSDIISSGISSANLSTNIIKDKHINTLSIDTLNAGILKITDGSTCRASFGGAIDSTVRDGRAYFYEKDAGMSDVEIVILGAATAGYVAKFDGSVVPKGGIRVYSGSASYPGINVSNTSTGCGVYSHKTGAASVSGNDIRIAGVGGTGYGGFFQGNPAPVCLYPDVNTSAPVHTANKGSLWVTSEGKLYINIAGSTAWQLVGSQT